MQGGKLAVVNSNDLIKLFSAHLMIWNLRSQAVSALVPALGIMYCRIQIENVLKYKCFVRVREDFWKF